MTTLTDGNCYTLATKIVCLLIIYQHNGPIICSVSNCRHYSADLEQGELKIPCKIKFSTSSSVEKEKTKFVTAALSNFSREILTN